MPASFKTRRSSIETKEEMAGTRGPSYPPLFGELRRVRERHRLFGVVPILFLVSATCRAPSYTAPLHAIHHPSLGEVGEKGCEKGNRGGRMKEEAGNKDNERNGRKETWLRGSESEFEDSTCTAALSTHIFCMKLKKRFSSSGSLCLTNN